MTDRKVIAPLYPNTKKQHTTLEQLDGMLLDASQCLVEQIEGKVRRLIFNLFDGQTVRARTAHPFGDASVKEVAIRREGPDWVSEITYDVPERRHRHRGRQAAAKGNGKHHGNGHDQPRDGAEKPTRGHIDHSGTVEPMVVCYADTGDNVVPGKV